VPLSQDPGAPAASGAPLDDALRVLIADDSEMARRLAAAAVAALGHEVVGEADDGLSAVAAALELEPDVVVMDWQMPRMDGLAATAAIRDRRPRIAIIGYSTAKGPEIEDAFMRAGACAFVYKADRGALLSALQARSSRGSPRRSG
jgi:DNA-binding NarL/FixJ family response regulator